jgi:phosphoribosylglycinamide formyltransferase-1
MSIKIAVLLSGRQGRGSNMTAISHACAKGQIDGEIISVIGNHAASPALEQANALGHTVEIVPSPLRSASNHEIESYEQSLYKVLLKNAPDLICLAGYLRKLPDIVVQAWQGRILNTHPALLPSFGGQGMYGIKVHQAAIDYGVKVSGCTVHFVDQSYDTGPIILQVPVPVMEDDTAEKLASRVLTAEHRAYPEAVALFAENRLTIIGRRVIISLPAARQ